MDPVAISQKMSPTLMPLESESEENVSRKSSEVLSPDRLGSASAASASEPVGVEGEQGIEVQGWEASGEQADKGQKQTPLDDGSSRPTVTSDFQKKKSFFSGLFGGWRRKSTFSVLDEGLGSQAGKASAHDKGGEEGRAGAQVGAESYRSESFSRSGSGSRPGSSSNSSQSGSRPESGSRSDSMSGSEGGREGSARSGAGGGGGTGEGWQIRMESSLRVDDEEEDGEDAQERREEGGGIDTASGDVQDVLGVNQVDDDDDGEVQPTRVVEAWPDK